MKRSIFFLMLIICLSTRLCHAQVNIQERDREIVFYNWESCTDKSILQEFEKKTGIKVILKEYRNQPMMVAEMQSNPEEFDVILTLDSMVPLLAEYRLLSELDLSKIPNIKYAKKELKSLATWPEEKYWVMGPTWGTEGLVVNTDFVPEDIDSWAVFWDKKYKGRIALVDEARDAVGVLLRYSHLSANTTDPKELAIAAQNAKLLKENDVQLLDELQILEKVIKGELWIGQVYGGDTIRLAYGKKGIKYIFPKEGFFMGLDAFVVSGDSDKKAEAYQLINFLLEPRIAARIATFISYPLAVKAESFLDQEILKNPWIYPPEDIIKKCEVINDIGIVENEYYKIFNFLKLKEKEK